MNVIDINQAKERIAIKKRITILKDKIEKLDKTIEVFSEMNRDNFQELYSPSIITLINNNQFIISQSKRNLALDILEIAKKNNSMISYKESLIIAEYLLIGNKKIEKKSFYRFIEFKIIINNSRYIEK